MTNNRSTLPWTEYLPFIKRWELNGRKWEYVTFPLNGGGTRDIPLGAKFHPSVLKRMQLSQSEASRYTPINAVTVTSNDETKLLRDVELVHRKGDQYLCASQQHDESYRD